MFDHIVSVTYRDFDPTNFTFLIVTKWPNKFQNSWGFRNLGFIKKSRIWQFFFNSFYMKQYEHIIWDFKSRAFLGSPGFHWIFRNFQDLGLILKSGTAICYEMGTWDLVGIMWNLELGSQIVWTKDFFEPWLAAETRRFRLGVEYDLHWQVCPGRQGLHGFY